MSVYRVSIAGGYTINPSLSCQTHALTVLDQSAPPRQQLEQGKSFHKEAPNFWERCRVLTGRFARIYWYKWSIYNVFGPLFLALVTGLFLACMCLNVDKVNFREAQNFMNMLALTVFTLARNGLHTSAVCGFARTCWCVDPCHRSC